ncbi:MAG: hypothetical protein JWN21_191 [Sphingomonas bacterium]|uniref:CPBP family glutamic-type intramembrane protease n=1 Tax=Sphingomonas bacterium TaxID=1895847 RepID=UPI00260AF3DB|nr:CPBP family glutamic-type intramembrane protease [Sphingomonas bacterium]MDB5694648.1 hypothetical protein [Sphingomonas bacterium]
MTLRARAGWPGGRPRALAFLPRFLFADTGPVWRYVLFAWPVVALPALALAWLASRLASGLAGPDLGGGPQWMVFAGVVLFSPIVETLMMSGPVALIDRWRGPLVAVVGSALLWGVLHSLLAARWGLVVWWPFLIFSIAYLTWRPRGYWPAIGVAAAIHVLNNAAPILALLVLN